MPAPRSRIALGVLFLLVLAGGACSTPTGPAGADGATPELSQAELRGASLDQLRNANWDCQPRGPFISCGQPGIGLPPVPTLGEGGRPTYHLSVFLPDGTPVGTAHFIRADLYRGQTCAFSGQPFVFRAIIGYYECFKPADQS